MPETTQARLFLAQRMLRETLKGVSEALAHAKLAPLSADEKEALWGALEEGAWTLPDPLFRGAEADLDGWVEEMLARGEVRGVLDDAVKRALAGRERRAPRPGP